MSLALSYTFAKSKHTYPKVNIDKYSIYIVVSMIVIYKERYKNNLKKYAKILDKIKVFLTFT